MKQKTTKQKVAKYALWTNKKIYFIPNSYKVGDLFQFRTANCYNAGLLGWNWDEYIFDNVIIIKGYRNFIGQQVPLEIEEEMAQEVRDYATTSIEKCEQLLEKFINKLNNYTR